MPESELYSIPFVMWAGAQLGEHFGNLAKGFSEDRATCFVTGPQRAVCGTVLDFNGDPVEEPEDRHRHDPQR